MSSNSRFVQASGYLAAFLPGAAIDFSSHINALRHTPLAISFVLIAAIARMFGRGSSILAPILTAIWFNYVVAAPRYAWALSSEGMVETSIILLLGFVIAYLFQGQRDAQGRTRSASQALEEKTNALIQAQQGSNSAAWSFDPATRKTTWYEVAPNSSDVLSPR